MIILGNTVSFIIHLSCDRIPPMAIRSMTGYGRVQKEHQGWQITAEIRSVNHRGLDTRVVLPPSLLMVEPAIRQAVRKHCQRGRVECRITARPNEADITGGAVVEQAKQLAGTLETIRKHLGFADPVDLADLLRAGLELQPTQLQEDMEWLSDVVVEAADDALRDLVEAREAEGAVLRADFEDRSRLVAALVERVAELAEEAEDSYRNRLNQRVNETLQQLQSAMTIDENRFLQELAIVLDKADITEEIVRARSHNEILGEIFGQGNPKQEPMGKRIDFFLQELAREANTMASKSLKS